jgi:succinyl-CoA synthetase alpha subunit
MSVLVGKDTRVIVQQGLGATGSSTRLCRSTARRWSRASAPGKGGTDFEGCPLFDTVAQAVKATGRSVADLRAAAVAPDAILEAPTPGCRSRVHHRGDPDARHGARAASRAGPGRRALVGPNCPGVITPGAARSASCRATSTSRAVGVVSRAARSRTRPSPAHAARLGQSTCIGIGGDPIIGTASSTRSALQTDRDTDAIIMIGEIGGIGEEEAAAVHQGT